MSQTPEKSIIENPKNQTEKISSNDNYIPYSLLKDLIQETNIPKKIIEEINSELWYETLSGNGKISFLNRLKYNGPIKNGILESQILNKNEKEEKKNEKNEICKITFKDNTKYIGEIHNNKITGKGKYIFPSGAIYIGDLLNGFRNGYGKYTTIDGISYEGNWKNGLKNGIGKMINSKMTYEGNWLNGNINGYGKIKWKNGNLYEGYFNNNCINGNGYMIWFDLLEKYIGNWENNLQNGIGIHIFFELKGENKLLRNRYFGEFKNGIRNGFGIFFYCNGSVYEGEWKNNMKNGFGSFLFENGKMYIGRFENDKMIDFDNQLSDDMCIKLYDNYLQMKEDIIKIERNKRLQFEINEDKNRKLKLNSVDKSSKKMSMVDLRVLSKGNKNKSNKISSIENEEIKKNTNKNIVIEYKENAKEIINKNKKIQDPKKKSLNRFAPYLDINDLILLDNSIKDNVTEIENVILRQLSEIKKCYFILLKIASGELKDLEDMNSSKTVNQEKLKRKSTKRISNIKNLIGSNIGQNNIIPENPKSNDISFCISMKDIWNFFRDNNIINHDFTISDFDKIYYNGNNYFNIYQIPDQINESSEIYKYMELLFNDIKVNFTYKYKNYIIYYYKEKEIPSYFKNILDDSNKNKKIEHKIENSIHFKNHIILPRFFNECLVRVAFLKYLSINIPLSSKLKILLDSIIKIPKGKSNKRISISKFDSSFQSYNINENKNKIHERFKINEFIFNFYSQVQKIFKKLYFLSCEHPSKIDQTISYRFIYNFLFKKSYLLMRLYPDKISFCELIQYFFKEKINFFSDEMNTEKRLFIIEKLFDNEIIEYEFFELVYLISKKYFSLKEIKGEKEDYLNFITKLEEIINCQQKKKLKKIYYFPELDKHIKKVLLIDKLKKEAIERERKRIEEERFTRERENLNKEDENIYHEEIESAESNDDEDYI